MTSCQQLFHKGVVQVKVLLGFAFGHRGGEPGISNEDMGSYAIVHWSEWQYHSLQWEIAQVVKRLGVLPEHVMGEGGLGRWYHTPEIVCLQLDDFQARGYDLSDLDYYVLCHKTHWSGCLWFLKQGLIARGVANPTVVCLSAKARYDSVSWQVSTRSPIHVFVQKFGMVFSHCGVEISRFKRFCIIFLEVASRRVSLRDIGGWAS